MSEAAAFSLHLPDAVQSHWNDGQAKIFGEEADATLERSHAAIFGIVDLPFGKDQHAIAAIRGFPGKAEAFAEAGKLRQRKNVEEQGGEPVAELIGPASGEEPLLWRPAHALLRFAPHG